MNRFSRKQVVIVLSLLAVLFAGGHGVWQKYGERLTNPYYGLNTYFEVQMDEATRVLIQQRLATAQASLAAQQQNGEDVDTQLYLVIAEQHKMLGDLVASRETYEAYLDRVSTSHVAWNAYAKILDLMNDVSASETAYAKTLSVFHGEEYYRDYVGFLQRRFPERRADVKVLLDEAYTRFGQTLWTMTALGDWYFDAKDCTQGKAHYDVAIALSDDDATLRRDVQELLEACEQR